MGEVGGLGAVRLARYLDTASKFKALKEGVRMARAADRFWLLYASTMNCPPCVRSGASLHSFGLSLHSLSRLPATALPSRCLAPGDNSS
jgi:hypothetical protein